MIMQTKQKRVWGGELGGGISFWWSGWKNLDILQVTEATLDFEYVCLSIYGFTLAFGKCLVYQQNLRNAHELN